MRERDVMVAIQLAANKYHCTLFRNQVGMLRDVRGIPVRFGLAVGSSDLIGWTICDAAAIFTAVEVKMKGKKPTQQQQAFLDAVIKAGGIACVAYSIEDVKRAIQEWYGD